MPEQGALSGVYRFLKSVYLIALACNVIKPV